MRQEEQRRETERVIDSRSTWAELVAEYRKMAMEQRRIRKNRAARARHEAYTSMGMKRTPYGYE